MTHSVTAEAKQGITAGGARQYLTFKVHNERMAIAILDVKEIIEVANMTRVPMTSGNILGVINLRGSVVPVVDLSYRLKGEKSQLSKRSCIVLVEQEIDGEIHPMGMLVETVNEILEIPDHQIQKAPDFGTDIPAAFIGCMARYHDDFIIMLNIALVMNADELSGLPQTSAADSTAVST